MVQTPYHLMRHTINVTRPAKAKDSGGSPTEIFAVHLTGIQAFVQPMGAAEVLRAGRDTSRWTATCFIEPGLDIQGDDRVYWVDGDKTCKVEGVEIDQAGMGVVSSFLLVEVTP